MLVTLELSDNTNKDVAILRKEECGVEDNNNPAPKNIPTPDAMIPRMIKYMNSYCLVDRIRYVNIKIV